MLILKLLIGIFPLWYLTYDGLMSNLANISMGKTGEWFAENQGRCHKLVLCLLFLFIVLPLTMVSIFLQFAVYLLLAFLLVLPQLFYCFYVWGRWVFCRKRYVCATSQEEEEARWLLEPGANTAALQNKLME